MVVVVACDCGRQVSLWQCFLQSSTNTVRHRYNHGGNMDVTGIDSVMLQCCAKANTVRCRELCQRVSQLTSIFTGKR